MKEIGGKIKCILASEEPLSADVYYIRGDQYAYIFDVGNNDESLLHIKRVEKDKIIILSHYHEDHVGNIKDVDYHRLYVGRKTREAIETGTIVKSRITIDDGVKIEIIPCPSPHTDGSLIMSVDNEYTLIADLYFTRPPFDKVKALRMLETVQSLDTKYFVISHLKEKKVVPKDELIAELKDYFNH